MSGVAWTLAVFEQQRPSRMCGDGFRSVVRLPSNDANSSGGLWIAHDAQRARWRRYPITCTVARMIDRAHAAVAHRPIV